MYRWLQQYNNKMLATIIVAKPLKFIGAGEMNRTPDLLITNDEIYAFGGVCLR